MEQALHTISPSNGTATFDFPESYRELMRDAPQDYVGEARVQWFAERMNLIPLEERDQVRAMFDRLAAKMVDLNASDLDLGGPACKNQVWYRVDGDKKPYPSMGRLSFDEADLLFLSLLSPMQQDRLVQKKGVDFGYSVVTSEGEKARRFRTTIYFDMRHLALCNRMLAWEPRSLPSLGFDPVIERALMFRYVRDGLTLITGVTGSGKSTTLDAIVDANNEDFDGHILIVAQPIEFIHESKRCIVRHRDVGTDVDSFVDGMVQGLRQDPDIVVVGEMRNVETIETAMETADTGHKVFSTLHTGSAIETIDRIIAEYPTDEQDRVRHRLADVLRCVISQKLLPSVGGGRVLAKEVMWMTPSARAAIKNNNAGEIYQMIWQGEEHGMVTLEQDLYRLVRTGDVSVDVAMGFANNKRRLLQLLQ